LENEAIFNFFIIIYTFFYKITALVVIREKCTSI